jgi:hypothetical protein
MFVSPSSASLQSKSADYIFSFSEASCNLNPLDLLARVVSPFSSHLLLALRIDG